MKEKNFNRTTLNLYDRKLVEQLEQDFTASGMRSKSEYFASLIKLGLQAKSISGEIVNLTEQMNGMQARLEELQTHVLKEQTESKIYKKLLCNIYRIIEGYCMYGELPSDEQMAYGLCDHLPDRLFYKLEKLLEVYGAA